jgi:hypothetical protein
MDTAIGIMFDHAGPIGLALTILAIYWLQALGVLVVPTWRARVEWVDTPESVTEQAQQLVQVGQQMQAKEHRIVHPIVHFETEREALLKARRIRRSANNGPEAA